MNPLESELVYLPAEIPKLGTWQTLRPGVHWVRMPLPYALDHINLWALDDGDGCSASCEIEEGYACPTPGDPCVEIVDTCGDGYTV